MHSPHDPQGRRRAPVIVAPGSNATSAAPQVRYSGDAAAAPPSRRRFLGQLTTAFGIAGTAGAGGLLAGCGGGVSDELAYLRFCHTGVDDASADFWVAGSRVVAGLADGGTVGGWLEGEAGGVSLAWHAAGSSTARLTETRSLDTDSYTSVIAWGTLASSLKFRYLAETNSAASSGSVKLRGFHAAPSIGAVNVYVTNTSSLDGLDPTFTLSAAGTLGDFVTLSSGTWRVRVTNSGDSSSLLFDYSGGVTLGSTAVVTLVLSPRASGSLPNVALLAEKSGSALLGNELV